MIWQILARSYWDRTGLRCASSELGLLLISAIFELSLMFQPQQHHLRIGVSVQNDMLARVPCGICAACRSQTRLCGRVSRNEGGRCS